MRIAILSWGSLITSGRERGLAFDGEWQTGGPSLPIEFSRVSQSGERAGCLTLVIDEKNGIDVTTRYVVSAMTHLDWALNNLRFVENITLKYSVGYVNRINNSVRGWALEKTPISCQRIKQWAIANRFDGVIWTSLLSNFEKTLLVPFSKETAVSYINGLSPELKAKALEYIMNAPVEVVTPFRTMLMSQYGRTTESGNQTVECVDDGEETLMRFINKFRRKNNQVQNAS